VSKYLQKITETTLYTAKEDESLAAFLGDLNINNPDRRMAGSPFVA
jgi:hypothetical protein